MSILINNNLIWVSIPRCASLSIEKTLMNIKELKTKHFLDYNNLILQNKIDEKIPFHYHIPLDLLYRRFGKKESICITRNWFERWMSSFEHIFKALENKDIKPDKGIFFDGQVFDGLYLCGRFNT